MNIDDFSGLRYGMFIHYGLFSVLERGEWVMNRENIQPNKYEKLAKIFKPNKFSAYNICKLAYESGMKYIVFTTMHHDGFRLYNSKINQFNSWNFAKRDLVKEIISAAKQFNLKIGLYHSLNNWHDTPDAVKALENREDYSKFIENTFARLKELVTLYQPIDILWYDGWWPFDKDGWQAERMNDELRKIQPHLLFNGRNCLPGDFGTPEQHLTAPTPWRPWEGCVTLNDHWGYYHNDNNYKSPIEIIKMLLACGNTSGNLLLNISPKANGSIPKQSIKILKKVGEWLRNGGEEAIKNNTPLIIEPELQTIRNYSGDWDHQGILTSSKNILYFTLLYGANKKVKLSGLIGKVKKVKVKGYGELIFEQSEDKISIIIPKDIRNNFAPVLAIEFLDIPGIYRTGGMNVPNVEHPRYDPITPDIKY